MKTKVFLMPAAETTWETPQWLFNRVNAIMNFDTDVCASGCNAKCEHYFDIYDDGLSQSWGLTNWMNPPYGREISKWLCKALEETNKGKTTVALVPASTSTRWWHEYTTQKKRSLRFH